MGISNLLIISSWKAERLGVACGFFQSLEFVIQVSLNYFQSYVMHIKLATKKCLIEVDYW